ncbi:MAG TPA: F0F1 ATP synthase subunit A [Candidatus Binatia bacterium]|nr:F0F1 ATP synthase subunit A [Candidatus Binatia bacterium]
MPRSPHGASVPDERHHPDPIASPAVPAVGAAPAGVGAAEDAAVERPRGSRLVRNLGLLIAAVIAIDILAVLFVPPFPPGEPGAACEFPVCFIAGNLELPAPHVVFDLDPSTSLPEGPLAIGFDASISSSLFTMWIVMAVVLGLAVLATRRMREVPRGIQNVVEFAYEQLSNFATSIGGPGARAHVPFYAAFFLLILFSNWSGLVPPVGKLPELRAPTSDVNVTIGLALVAFAYFEFQGLRANGVLGYLAKFFPVGEFRKGIGAGLIALFVGLIELMLEFVKPVTLSMRLFGNIYGGEVALGVLTALTIAVIPVALFALELMLNFVQALIFSVLMLIFTLVAVESHHEEEGHAEPADAPAGDRAPAPAPAH